MLFNLNEFLLSISFILDFAEMDILGNKTNHSKRVAYISYQIGKRLGLSVYELFDLVSLSIIHDNGIIDTSPLPSNEKSFQDYITNTDLLTEVNLHEYSAFNRVLHEGSKSHCILGERNISNYPFYTDVENVILLHHENYDGSGFFNRTGNEIPLMSQIIRFADAADNFTYLPNLADNRDNIKILYHFIRQASNILFSKTIGDTFIEISSHNGFWLDLKNEFIDISLKKNLPNLSADISLKDIFNVTKIYSNLVDSKSSFTKSHSDGLTQKASHMARYYQMNEETTYKFIIAARLHDIGKLAVSNDILDKAGALNQEELDSVQKHTYYTRICLSQITGFEEITEWAANHHEKLDGSGYPYGLTEKDLDFNSRLMACLDIYQALTEERPYRSILSHEQAAKILLDMAALRKIDGNILKDILTYFEEVSL